MRFSTLTAGTLLLSILAISSTVMANDLFSPSTQSTSLMALLGLIGVGYLPLLIKLARSRN